MDGGPNLRSLTASQIGVTFVAAVTSASVMRCVYLNLTRPSCRRPGANVGCASKQSSSTTPEDAATSIRFAPPSISQALPPRTHPPETTSAEHVDSRTSHPHEGSPHFNHSLFPTDNTPANGMLAGPSGLCFERMQLQRRSSQHPQMHQGPALGVPAVRATAAQQTRFVPNHLEHREEETISPPILPNHKTEPSLQAMNANVPSYASYNKPISGKRLPWFVFWDFENVRIPHGVSIPQFVHSLRLFLANCRNQETVDPVIRILAVGNSNILPKDHIPQLFSLGVTVHHVKNFFQQKDFTDKVILTELCLLTHQQPPPCGIALISGDSDFSYCVSKLTALSYHTVVIGLKNYSRHIANAPIVFVTLDDVLKGTAIPHHLNSSGHRPSKKFHGERRNFWNKRKRMPAQPKVHSDDEREHYVKNTDNCSNPLKSVADKFSRNPRENPASGESLSLIHKPTQGNSTGSGHHDENAGDKFCLPRDAPVINSPSTDIDEGTTELKDGDSVKTRSVPFGARRSWKKKPKTRTRFRSRNSANNSLELKNSIPQEGSEKQIEQEQSSNTPDVQTAAKVTLPSVSIALLSSSQLACFKGGGTILNSPPMPNAPTPDITPVETHKAARRASLSTAKGSTKIVQKGNIEENDISPGKPDNGTPGNTLVGPPETVERTPQSVAKFSNDSPMLKSIAGNDQRQVTRTSRTGAIHIVVSGAQACVMPSEPLLHESARLECIFATPCSTADIKAPHADIRNSEFGKVEIEIFAGQDASKIVVHDPSACSNDETCETIRPPESALTKQGPFITKFILLCLLVVIIVASVLGVMLHADLFRCMQR